MLWLILLVFIINVIYNGFIIFRYKKIPISLSETAYLLGGPEMGNKKYFFTLYCTIIAVCILPYLLTILPENILFLGFLMCAGLIFAGMSPMFREGLDKKVHYVSAIISFLSFIILLIINASWYSILLYALLLILLIMWKKECYIYFAEILILFFIWTI